LNVTAVPTDPVYGPPAFAVGGRIGGVPPEPLEEPPPQPANTNPPHTATARANRIARSQGNPFLCYPVSSAPEKIPQEHGGE
jgi:hypothetical protein